MINFISQMSFIPKVKIGIHLKGLNPRSVINIMNISVNDNPLTVEEHCTASDLVNKLFEGKHNGIAISVNQQVIPRATWENHLINSNDNVLIIRATQGG